MPLNHSPSAMKDFLRDFCAPTLPRPMARNRPTCVAAEVRYNQCPIKQLETENSPVLVRTRRTSSILFFQLDLGKRQEVSGYSEHEGLGDRVRLQNHCGGV